MLKARAEGLKRADKRGPKVRSALTSEGASLSVLTRREAPCYTLGVSEEEPTSGAARER
jgi:hypothetical protein